MPKPTQTRRFRLEPCPRRPNCVSSLAPKGTQFVEPYAPADAADLRSIRSVLERTERCTVVEATDTYLHAEFRSRWFGFVDDFELELDADRSRIHVRSASRLGYSDLGTNRRRVERIRAIWAEER